MPDFDYTDLLPFGKADTPYRLLAYTAMRDIAHLHDFPAFVVVDDKGDDFFADTTGPLLTIGARA